MKANRLYTLTTAMAILLVGLGTAMGQATRPAATQTAQTTGKNLTAKVIAVTGRYVEYKLPGQAKFPVSPKQRLTVGQILPAGTEIRTGFASKAKVQLHTTALIEIQSGTRIAITELMRLPDREKTRINISRGTIVGGILEEKVRSDFQIVCPAAVLSREGTWAFRFSYDPATGNFDIALDTDGLVRVVQTATGRRRALYPGQHVNQAFKRWAKIAVFDRMVSLTDPFGATRIELLNYAQNSGGLAALDPTGSNIRMFLASRLAAIQTQVTAERRTRQLSRTLAQQRFTQQLLSRPRTGEPGQTTPQTTFSYRSGNFGTHISDKSTSSVWQNLINRQLANKSKRR